MKTIWWYITGAVILLLGIMFAEYLFYVGGHFVLPINVLLSAQLGAIHCFGRGAITAKKDEPK